MANKVLGLFRIRYTDDLGRNNSKFVYGKDKDAARESFVLRWPALPIESINKVEFNESNP